MKKIILMITILALSVSISGCSKQNSKKVLAQDVSKEIKEEVSEASQLLNNGLNALNEGDYVNAKINFDKVIELDKSNKEVYIKIKDYYLGKSRYNDAYYIVKRALDNKIDEKNMTDAVNEIKAHFPVIELNDKINQNDYYELPSSAEVDIDGEIITMPINWNNQVVDISKVGIAKYEGYNEQYGKSFALELEIAAKQQAPSKVINDVEVRNMIVSGVNILFNIFEEDLGLYRMDPIEYNNSNYVESPTYKSAEELKMILSKYFSRELTEKIANKAIINKNGKTYFIVANLGVRIDSYYLFDIKYGDDKVNTNAQYKYYDDNGNIYLEVKRDYELIYEDNTWKINKMQEAELQ